MQWDRGQPHTRVHRHVWGRDLPFLVEHTRADCAHACTVDDLAEMLGMLPKRHINNYADIVGIRGIVLRQPTRKEDGLNPVWARLGYGVAVGGIVGPVVFIEAQRIPLTVRWPTKLGPHDVEEVERLVAAADVVERSRRSTTLRFGLEAVRRVQLFHSLPHEVGHWADMYEHVERPALEDFEAWERLWDRYFQRPGSEREQFAHRYAEQAVAQLRKTGVVPFERRFDPEALTREGLRPEDFSERP